MLTFFSTLTFLLGMFLFSFVLWRNLREDYSDEQIFYLTLGFFFGGGLGGLVAGKFLPPDFWFWGFIAGFLALGVYVVLKLKIKFFDAVDSVVISTLWFLMLFYLSRLLRGSFPGGFLLDTSFVLASIEFFISGISIVLFYIFIVSYRSFSWYISGKIGFAGLASLACFFLTRSLIAVYKGWVISFSSWWVDFFLSLVCFFGLVVVVYLRSGRRMGKRRAVS